MGALAIILISPCVYSVCSVVALSLESVWAERAGNGEANPISPSRSMADLLGTLTGTKRLAFYFFFAFSSSFLVDSSASSEIAHPILAERAGSSLLTSLPSTMHLKAFQEVLISSGIMYEGKAIDLRASPVLACTAGVAEVTRSPTANLVASEDGAPMGIGG